MKGANLYKNYFQPFPKSQVDVDLKENISAVLYNVGSVPKPVESILVCTGVYSPQNDVVYNTRKQQEGKKENLADVYADKEGSDEIAVDKHRIKAAQKNHGLRKNSFINYFEDSLNIPDLTVNNLNDAVDYILKNL